MNEKDVSKILYVVNLHYYMNNELLSYYFEKIVKCISCNIIRQYEDDPFPYAIIELDNSCDFDIALKEMNGVRFITKNIKIVQTLEDCQNHILNAFKSTLDYANKLRNHVIEKSEQNQAFLNKLKDGLKEFNDNLKLLEQVLNRPADFIYDFYSEMKRRIQLDTEETIASIKQSNDIDINTHESQLDPILFNKVNNIIEQSQEMIDKIEDYQKKILKSCLNNKHKNHEKIVKHLEEYKNHSQTLKQQLVDIVDQHLIDSFEKMNDNFEELFSKEKFKHIHLNELKEYLKKSMLMRKKSKKFYFELTRKKNFSQTLIDKVKSRIFPDGRLELHNDDIDQDESIELDSEKKKDKDELSCYLEEDYFSLEENRSSSLKYRDIVKSTRHIEKLFKVLCGNENKLIYNLLSTTV